jgi:uncharacterized protein (TIGR00251 family)
VRATLVVHVVPRARRTAVSGRHGDAIKITLAAPPVDGAANTELVRFVAARLGLAAGAVTITRGAAGRRKTLAVVGLDTAAARRALLEPAG